MVALAGDVQGELRPPSLSIGRAIRSKAAKYDTAAELGEERFRPLAQVDDVGVENAVNATGAPVLADLIPEEFLEEFARVANPGHSGPTVGDGMERADLEPP
jgi:hypothetical protein